MLFSGPQGRARLLGFVAILWTQALLQSCVSTDSKSLNESAATLGKLAAHRTIPPIPNDCRIEEPHVDITPGADPWTLLGEEGNHLNLQNQRTRRCNGIGGFYDQMKATQEKATR